MVLLLLHPQQNISPHEKPKIVLPKNDLKNKRNNREKFDGKVTLTGRVNPSGTGFLLCCVCHEQNTTYRYEVVYKATAKDKDEKGEKKSCCGST